MASPAYGIQILHISLIPTLIEKFEFFMGAHDPSFIEHCFSVIVIKAVLFADCYTSDITSGSVATYCL